MWHTLYWYVVGRWNQDLTGHSCSFVLLKGSAIHKGSSVLLFSLQDTHISYHMIFEIKSAPIKLCFLQKQRKKNQPTEGWALLQPHQVFRPLSGDTTCTNPNLVSVELFPLVCFHHGMCHPKTGTPVSLLRRCLSEDLPGREQGVLKEELGCGWKHGVALLLQKKLCGWGRARNQSRCVTLSWLEGVWEHYAEGKWKLNNQRKMGTIWCVLDGEIWGNRQEEQ